MPRYFILMCLSRSAWPIFLRVRRLFCWIVVALTDENGFLRVADSVWEGTRSLFLTSLRMASIFSLFFFSAEDMHVHIIQEL